MNMTMVIAGGIILLGLFLLFGNFWDGNRLDLTLATKTFVPAWLAVALVNIWVCVALAGYSIGDALLILFTVFMAPAAIAGVVIWRLTR